MKSYYTESNAEVAKLPKDPFWPLTLTPKTRIELLKFYSWSQKPSYPDLSAFWNSLHGNGVQESGYLFSCRLNEMQR